MPPFSTEAFTALEGNPSLRQWWHYYKNEFSKLLEKQEKRVVPLFHPAHFELDDTYMFDGWHPNEVYITHLVKGLIETSPNSSFLKNVSIERLLMKIKNAAIPLAFNLPDTPTVTSPN